jgi:hypothetical protein
MWIFNGKKIYQINYFINVMIIQNNVLRVILGWDISLCTSTMNVPCKAKKKGAKKQAQKCMKLSLFAWGIIISHLLLNNDCSLYGKFIHSH